MRHSKWAIILTALVILAGCQNMAQLGQTDQLATKQVEEARTEPDCQGDSCAKVSASYVSFPNSPALTQQVEQALFNLAGGINDSESPDGKRANTFDEFAQQLFASSQYAKKSVPETPPFEAQLNGKLLEKTDKFLVLELSGYLYSGGAHGMPMTQYMVIDRATQQQIGLSEMLLPNQSDKFYALLKKAHARWLESDEAEGLTGSEWPFAKSDNAAPLKQGLTVKYQVYDIAPYAVGQPELVIPYSELKGVLKARYVN